MESGRRTDSTGHFHRPRGSVMGQHIAPLSWVLAGVVLLMLFMSLTRGL